MTGKFSDFFLGAYALRGGGGGKKERKFQTQASSRPNHAQCASIGRITQRGSHWLSLAHQHAQIAPIGPALARIQPIGSYTQRNAHSRIGPTGPMWPHQARSGSLGKALLDQAPQCPSIGPHWASHWPPLAVALEPLECKTPDQIAQTVGV